MALFGLTDVQITPPVTRKGEYNLDPNSEGETFNFRYPLELGTEAVGHHVQFSIFAQEYEGRSENMTNAIGFSNAQNATQNATARYRENITQDTGFVAGSFLNSASKISNAIVKELASRSGSVLSVVNSATSGLSAEQRRQLAQATAQSVNNFTSSLNASGDLTGNRFLNRVKRIKNNISLYMPDTLSFSYSQQYADVSTNFGLMQVGADIISQIMGGKSITDAASKNLSPFVYEALSSFGDIGKINYIAATNTVYNPQMELIYSNPNFREFQFQFAFYPRSIRESEHVFKIVNLLKFHQAPEIKSGDAGFFLIPPSLFDINFFANGMPNKNLPGLGSCVLTNISVDYAPHGWTAYETSGQNSDGMVGRTGAPVAIKMSLTFKETVIHNKSSHRNWETDSV